MKEEFHGVWTEVILKLKEKKKKPVITFSILKGFCDSYALTETNLIFFAVEVFNKRKSNKGG